MKKLLSILSVFIMSFVQAQVTLHPGFNQVYIKAKTFSGFIYNQPCEIWCPDNYDQTSPLKYPVIISAHGNGEAGTDTVSVKNAGIMRSIVRGFPAQSFINGSEVKFIVVAPQQSSGGPDTSNWVSNYQDLTSRLLVSTGGIVKMDSSRVYITGYSAGGRYSIGSTSLAGTSDTVYSSFIVASVPMSPATQDITYANLHLAVPRGIHWLGISGSKDQAYYNQMFRVQDTIKKYSSLFPLADTVHESSVHCCWDTYWDSTFIVPGYGKNLYNWIYQWTKGSSNSPPNVNAGNDQTITLPTSFATLTGTASGNNGATIASTAWTFVSGPSTPTITTPASLTTTVTAMTSAGTYVYKLTATDNNGLVNSDMINIFVNASGNPPIVHAGGTYNFDTYTYNGGAMITITESTGNTHMKYSSVANTYFTGNDKITHLTSPGGEGRFIGVKGANSKNPWIIQFKLFPGDSIKQCYIKVTGTDTVTNLSSVDSALIVLRYPNDYPPQNTDGTIGGHRATAGDCAIYGAACQIGVDWVKAANADPVHKADGSSVNTGIYMNPVFLSDTFHVAPGGHVWIAHLAGQKAHYKRVWLQFDSAGSVTGPLGDTTKAQIIIDGQNLVEASDIIYCSNIRNVRLTGFKVDNHYQSYAGFSFQVDGMSTSWPEIDHDSSVRGNFSGLVAKFETGGLPPGHIQTYWDRVRIHDLFIKDCHGEDIYAPGSANTPSCYVRNSNIYNNVSLFSGNKLIKTLDLLAGDTVQHNVGMYGSLNYGSPFEPHVSVGQELTFLNYGNIVDHNLMVGFGDQGINCVTSFRGQTPVGTSNRITNNVWMQNWGPIGAFFAQQDSAFLTNIDSCFFGRYGPFKFGQIYNGGNDGTNTNITANHLPAGNLVGGFTRNTYHYTNNVCDSSKYILASGDATFILTGNTIVKQIAFPQFVSAPFQSVFPEQWIDIIYGTWGDEYPGSSNLQGTLKYFQTGDIVKWFDKFYISNINNNTNHVPSGGTDAFWTLLTWNGSTTPPIDPRLFTTDMYAQRGIGLLQQVAPSGANCGCATGRKGVEKTFHTTP